MKKSQGLRCVGMSEQLALDLNDTVKLQFQDTDADGGVTVQNTYCMSAELQLHLLPLQQDIAFYFKIHSFRGLMIKCSCKV